MRALSQTDFYAEGCQAYEDVIVVHEAVVVPAECVAHYLSMLLDVMENHGSVFLHLIWAFKQLGCLSGDGGEQSCVC